MNLKVELLDILAVVVLVSIVLLAYVLIAPTAIQQNLSASGLVQKTGGTATFYLNISALGGFREVSLNVGNVNFTAPAGWSYNISSPAFTVESSHNFSNTITVSVPASASPGSMANLTFLLYSRGNPSSFSTLYHLSVTASTSSFVLGNSEIITSSVTGINFVPWFAVIGPIALVTAMMGVGILVMRNRK